MPRVRAPQQVDRLIAAATSVFSAVGYRRAQMSDVARTLGASTGSLYLYAENKEALFDLVLRHGLHGPLSNRGLPVRTPARGATLAFLRGHIDQVTHWPLLAAAQQRRAPSDIRAELTAILDELATSLSRHRWGLLVLFRSSHDRPELAQAFLGALRARTLTNLEAYLRRRARHLRDLPDPATTAIFINEALSFWTLHRLADPSYAEISDETAARTAIDMLVHSLITG